MKLSVCVCVSFFSFWKYGRRMDKIIHPVDQWCCDWYLAPTHTMEYLRKKQKQKQNMKCQWKWRTDLKNEISCSVTYHAADRSKFSEWDQSVERCSEFMLCKWYWSQPWWMSAHKHLTSSCLTSDFQHHWLLCYFWVNAENYFFFFEWTYTWAVEL